MATIDRETGLPIIQGTQPALALGIAIALDDNIVKQAQANMAIQNGDVKAELGVLYNNNLIYAGTIEKFLITLAKLAEEPEGLASDEKRVPANGNIDE